MEIILALLIGGAFGAVLDRIGASNPTVIGGMLRLSDLRLMKAILLAIGIGAVLMFLGQLLGVVSAGHMSVKAAYLGVFVGGLLLGFGWALSGFCPGTGVVALGAGRRDALAFVLGGLLGAAAYMASFASVQTTGLLDSIAGGKVTLGIVPGAKFDALTSLPGDFLGILIGVIFVVVAFLLPSRLGSPSQTAPAH